MSQQIILPGQVSKALTYVQAWEMRNDLRKFSRASWPIVDKNRLVWNWHLDAICDHLSWITAGEIRFFLCNIPPRMSKSSICSVQWPVWDWTRTPATEWLTASYALQLSIRDTLKSRRLIESDWFQQRFGTAFKFSADEKLKKQYSNDKGGRRMAVAVESATTGEGGHRLLIDDPHNATEAESDVIRLGAHDWFDNAMQSRMNDQNKGSWCVIGQRTHADDLFAHILKEYGGSDVVNLVLPNEFDPKRKCITYSPKTKEPLFEDPREKVGELLCEKRVNLESSKRLKKTMKSKYALQYQQDPKAGDGFILKRSKWRKWDGIEPPECNYVFTVYDGAYGEDQQNDYSARTDWGVFRHAGSYEDEETGEIRREKERACIIMLGAWRDKIELHKLRLNAREHYKKFKPDHVLIEKAASGIPLLQEFRRAGIRAKGITYNHGGRTKIDKITRAEMASVVLDDGCVYYMDRNWSDDVIDECSAFPNSTNDDYVDTVVIAMQFVRRRNEIELWDDETEDGDVNLFKRKRSIYG